MLPGLLLTAACIKQYMLIQKAKLYGFTHSVSSMARNGVIVSHNAYCMLCFSCTVSISNTGEICDPLLQAMVKG